jgi:hypothetical protein
VLVRALSAHPARRLPRSPPPAAIAIDQIRTQPSRICGSLPMPPAARGIILAVSVPYSHLRSAFPAPLRCVQCGDVIGVYEPLVAIEPQGPHLTSVAAEPGGFSVGAACFHAACHERMSADSP